MHVMIQNKATVNTKVFCFEKAVFAAPVSDCFSFC